MLSNLFDNTVAWIGEHPVAAGIAIFLIAFSDSVILLGAIVPALPLLFGVGVLIGLGEVSGPYAVVCAALGALAGDGLSYWVGRRWGGGLRQVWPFHRYPQLLDRGELLFRRNSVKSILVARYVGAIRPFVPAIAGISRMPLRRYLPVSLFACVSWAAIFLAPGWIFGASYDAVAAVADRLAIVLGALIAVLALAWALVLYTYRWFDTHANNLLARALAWSRAHPRLGRYAGALIDPNRPESASLAILAVCLLAIGWAWFALLTTVLMRGEPLALDLSVYEAMIALRNPLADRLFAGLASIGDAPVLVPAAGLALLWLVWRRRFIAAAHWLVALAFGLVLTAGLEAAIDVPRPPTAHSGFGFPSMTVTMTTITFGFFAVLIARELPGRSRVWPYLLTGVVVALLGFARIYLGAHWLSDVVGGLLLGVVWLLGLGIAYRRHVARSFWMRPLALIFYLTFAAAAAWHAPRAVDPLLASFRPPAPTRAMTEDGWWADAWKTLPSRRNERSADQRWPLDIQVAGALEPLRARLQAQGWAPQPQADWIATLGLLDDDTPPAQQPVLPATLDTEAEVLLMRRPAGDGRLQVLRLWHAPALLDGEPLWVGTVQTLEYARPLFGLFGLWQPLADGHAAWRALREDLAGFETAEAVHPQSGVPVLRVRTRHDAPPG
ncbi:bifunctional DedA family/phosphatase PAP2 family protein [Luteimonas huabeiensis]|uniref:bifunctional DedA family/phosphatase PAP2 family protein n=1 Tax=Luteimonas huabeiensis TaxID=1244513 RepID=UPI00046589C2|nr:bifunctional DedA family/phosphatase PAP2 family protein [Luteimonas huabeiensis]